MFSFSVAPALWGTDTSGHSKNTAFLTPDEAGLWTFSHPRENQQTKSHAGLAFLHTAEEVLVSGTSSTDAERCRPVGRDLAPSSEKLPPVQSWGWRELGSVMDIHPFAGRPTSPHPHTLGTPLEGIGLTGSVISGGTEGLPRDPGVAVHTGSQDGGSPRMGAPASAQHRVRPRQEALLCRLGLVGLPERKKRSKRNGIFQKNQTKVRHTRNLSTCHTGL